MRRSAPRSAASRATMSSTLSPQKQRAMAPRSASSSPGPGSSCRSSSTGSTGSASAMRGADLGEARRRDAVRDQPEPIGVGAADRPACQRQVHADLVGHARERPARPVVREQPDPGFGHGEAIALSRDPVRTVERDAHARAHHHAVDQRHGGLGEAVELPVQRIFRRPATDGLRPVAAAPTRPVRARRRRRRRRARRSRRSPPRRSRDRGPRSKHARSRRAYPR